MALAVKSRLLTRSRVTRLWPSWLLQSPSPAPLLLPTLFWLQGFFFCCSLCLESPSFRSLCSWLLLTLQAWTELVSLQGRFHWPHHLGPPLPVPTHTLSITSPCHISENHTGSNIVLVTYFKLFIAGLLPLERRLSEGRHTTCLGHP